MTAYQRNKGARWEREVARRFREAMPGADVTRNRQAAEYDGLPDVSAPGFAIECKVGANPPWRKGLRQAVEAAAEIRIAGNCDCIPICVAKTDRRRPVVYMEAYRVVDLVLVDAPPVLLGGGVAAGAVVSMDLGEFLQLVGEWWGRQNAETAA